MYCKYCGAEIPDDANFCSKCGRSLNGGNSPVQGYQAGINGQVTVVFKIPESENGNEVRFWLDGKQMVGLYAGINQFSVQTTAGRHEVKFTSSPRTLTLFTKRRIGSGTQNLEFYGNTTIYIIRNGDDFEFSDQGWQSQSGSNPPTYI